MSKEKIAIVGKGNFGRGLQQLLNSYAPQFDIIMLDKLPDSELIGDLDVIKTCKVVIPAVPLSKFENVTQQISEVVQPGSIVIDVCTTKYYPATVMERLLPKSVDLIASHPLFGPESLRMANWNLTGLNLVIWPLRITDERFVAIEDALKATGMNIVRKSPEDHDKTLADSQFLSLLVGALLERLDITSSEMNTRSFDELLDVKETTRNDYHILLDVFRYNPFCKPKLTEVLKTVNSLGDSLRNYLGSEDFE
ncbi:MAG: prephenate dehydrogenase/arogenate dehydrogenase family protein [Calditrichia bacterium]